MRIAVILSIVVASSGALIIWKVKRDTDLRFLTGVVLAADADPHKQRPVARAKISAEYGGFQVRAASDGTGYFRLELDPPLPLGDPLELRCEHPAFRPFAETSAAGPDIRVFRLTPAKPQPAAVAAQTPIASVRIRYATKSTTTVNVASLVRTFDVHNAGNIPCNRRDPCSPDGKWKASFGYFTLSTGEDNKFFRNTRVSCIAGPCPFAAIEQDGYSRSGRAISVVVRNWSDRVTYLVEAEVAQTIQSELIRHTYPVIFGSSMNFTLPAGAQGPSIEAEIDGQEIVYPLGPKLILSWAACRTESAADGSRLYRCELKPGYRFK